MGTKIEKLHTVRYVTVMNKLLRVSRSEWQTLGWLWDDFEMTLEWLRDDFGMTLEWLWDDFGMTLEWLWDDFGMTLGK